MDSAAPLRDRVLDLRNVHVTWEIRPDKPSFVTDNPEYAEKSNTWHAILRDGRKRLFLTYENGRQEGQTVLCFTGTVESLRRLRDTLDRFLGDA